MTSCILKIFLVCILVCLASGGSARAASDGGGFNQGNALYATGDFAGAVGAYEGRVRRGDYTANLFYNLADAYYRQGNRGRAVLNYQRALILDPSHAEGRREPRFRARRAPACTRARRVGFQRASVVHGGGVLVGGGGVGPGAGGTQVASRRLRVDDDGGCLPVRAGVAAIWSTDDGARSPSRAVIVADSAPALYAPADNSKVITNLTAGGEVRVLSDQGAWVYVLLNDGTRAWLASDKIERVVPRL